MADLAIFLGLVAVGYFAGRAAERKHYKSIRRREQASHRMAVLSSKEIPDDRPVIKATLVSGSAVISVDYFKRVAAGLSNFFGGRVSAYESLLDRARREAVLRMKARALQEGCSMIVNMRLETSSVSGMKGRNRGPAAVEMFAYGTALKFQ